LSSQKVKKSKHNKMDSWLGWYNGSTEDKRSEVLH